MKIKTSKIPDYIPSYYVATSALGTNKDKYTALKQLIAVLVKENSVPHSSNSYFNWSITYRFLFEFSSNFKGKEENQVEKERSLNRTTHIIQHMEEHFREGLSLEKLVQEEGLSIPYLSSFFEKYLGTTFLSYYNEIRLSSSVNEFLSTDLSIEEIALENGLQSPRFFVSVLNPQPKAWLCIR